MTDRAHDICIRQNMREISVAESPFLCYRKLREYITATPTRICKQILAKLAAGPTFFVVNEFASLPQGILMIFVDSNAVEC